MKLLWGIVKRHKFLTSGLITLAVIGSMIGVQVTPVSLHPDSITIGQQHVIITIGDATYASGTVDYICDGTEDNIQFQGALDSLPVANGGTIKILAGNYDLQNATTVTRAIANVTIIGTGRGTYITCDGATAIFTAGGNNWTIRDLRTDAGGLAMGTTTGWSWENVTINATYYAYQTDDAMTASSWDIPTGRTATYVIAASDAPAHVKAQADYVCDGVLDDVQAKLAIAALTGGRTYKETIKFVGTFSITTSLVLESYTVLDLTEARFNLAGSTEDFIITANAKTQIDIVGGIIDGIAAGGITAHPIYFNTSDYIVIKGCTIQHFAGMGVFLNSCTKSSVIGNNFHAIGTVGGDSALWFSDGNHNEVSLNNFYDNQNGVSSQGLEYSSVSHNTFYNQTTDSINLTHSGVGKMVACVVVENTIETSTTVGSLGIILNNMDYCTVSGNTIKGIAGHGIDLDYSSYNTIANNTIVGCLWSGIVMYKQVAGGSSSNEIYGNIVYGCSTVAGGGDDSGIDVANDTCDYNSIHDNTIRVGTSSHQHSGIRVQAGAIGTLVYDNDLRDSYIGGQPLLDAGTSTVAYASYCDTFLDLTTYSQTDIRLTEDLSEAIPNTFTISAQPSHPRTINLGMSHTNITAFSITITGVDARGRIVSDIWTEAAGWGLYTNNAYSTITSIIMTARTGTGAGDICNVGSYCHIGLSKEIFATTDIYKATKNGANYSLASCTINTTYSTIKGIGDIAALEDWTIWYRVSLNILK